MRPGRLQLGGSVLDAGPDRPGGAPPVRVEHTLAGPDVLHRIGWSAQVPARQAAGRDEAAIAAWREETWLDPTGSQPPPLKIF
jgi:Winged helix-turn helix